MKIVKSIIILGLVVPGMAVAKIDAAKDTMNKGIDVHKRQMAVAKIDAAKDTMNKGIDVYKRQNAMMVEGFGGGELLAGQRSSAKEEIIGIHTTFNEHYNSNIAPDHVNERIAQYPDQAFQNIKNRYTDTSNTISKIEANYGQGGFVTGIQTKAADRKAEIEENITGIQAKVAERKAHLGEGEFVTGIQTKAADRKAEIEENITGIQTKVAEKKADIVALIESMGDDSEVTENE